MGVLCVGLLAVSAAPATADAGDASAVAARVSVSGTVLGTPVSVVDETLAQAAVSQGDADQEVTDTLLDIDVPLLGVTVDAEAVSSTAASDFTRAEASNFLTDVGVDLVADLDLVPDLELDVLTLDTVATEAFCPVFGEPQASVDPPVEATLLGIPVDIELDEDIEVDIVGVASAVLRISQIEVTSDSAHAVGLELSVDVNVVGLVTLEVDIVISESACERGLAATDVFTPTALEVDFQELISDANGVFEPGERVDVAPTWQNVSSSLVPALGDASNFTGPVGPNYSIAAVAADYGLVAAGGQASCRDTGMCYQMEAGPEGVERPAQHWDTSFLEEMSDGSTKTWTLHIGDSFLDLPRSNPFYRFVETIWHNGITLGCNDTDYCPNAPNTRGEMSVFILRSMLGSSYTPPTCDGDFADVPCPSIFANWIEDLASRGIASGCGGNNFCPGAPMTRAQMATFLLRGLQGPAYDPPTCNGVFVDVSCPSTFADWIEDLSVRGITSGCTATPGGYCPNQAVTRAEMAVFLTRTFGLQLYGP